MKEIPFDPDLIDDPWVFDEIPGFDDVSLLDPETIEQVKTAVEALPKDERAVVECLVWGQMTKVETGRLLGRSRQSVHDVMKRAIVTLVERLGELV